MRPHEEDLAMGLVRGTPRIPWTPETVWRAINTMVNIRWARPIIANLRAQLRQWKADEDSEVERANWQKIHR
jgi:hypothetical protein